MSTEAEIDPDRILQEIASKWKLVKFGAASKEPYYGLELIPRDYYQVTNTVEVSTDGGIGLDLVEAIDMGDGIGGLVLVGGVRTGSNAEKAGFEVGDAFFKVAQPDAEAILVRPNLEGLSYDRTLDMLGEACGASANKRVAITVQRIAKRKDIKTIIVGPSGEPVLEFDVLAGYGSNLRTALQSNNLKMYDDRTNRFDSPFQTGNCGGEGTCGTCMVAVLEGEGLVSAKKNVEQKALLKQQQPPNYRWACRLKIGMDPSKGGTIKIKLRPQTTLWDWQAKQ